jgi:hypothetical protein
MAEVRSRLASGEPLDLLAEASGLVAALDPRSRSPFERSAARDRGTRTLDELVRTFAEVDRIETSALLAGIAELAPDEVIRARARRYLADRRHVLPEWLRRLGEAEAYRCVEMIHVLGDGDDLIVGVHLKGGLELSVAIYVDHNLGTVAKDAFVVPGPIEELVAMMRQHTEAPLDTEWREIDRADARARITEALEHGALIFPLFESETWPACRPVVEWVARLLPEGGAGYERPEWDDAAKAALTESFFASEFGVRLDEGEYRDLFEAILWFATDYGPGDPLRWSPTAVEILLSDWIPRKIVAPANFLSRAPELLRALIGYAHTERGIRPGLTEETLDAVDQWEPEYQRTIRSPRPQGPAALLAAMGVLDSDGPWGLSYDDEFGAAYDVAGKMLESLKRAVGSEEALTGLTDEALPDEAFAWDGVPKDIRAKVREVLERCDQCCDELLDVEFRTACRRYLCRVATGNPEVFRRRGRSDTAAAAICWTVGKANDLFVPSGGGMLVKDLLAHFGLSQGSVSQRAATLMKAAGIKPDRGYYPAWDVALGSPDLLVASRRHRIIERRDRYLEPR